MNDALAESALGAIALVTGSDWEQEWLNLQLDRLGLAYFHNDRNDYLASLVETVRPVIYRSGTSAQRAAFFNSLVLSEMQRDRFVVSDETLENVHSYVRATGELGDPSSSAHARSNLGFCQLWRDEFDEAETELTAALNVARWIEDIGMQALCLTYLTIVFRRRGDIEAVQRAIQEVLSVSHAARRQVYVAVAHGNLAWISWRRRSLPQAETQARHALDMWRGGGATVARYPFQWIARLPLFAVVVTEDRIDEAIAHARALRETSQQPPPDSIDANLRAAIEAWDRNCRDAARHFLRQALERTQEKNYA